MGKLVMGYWDCPVCGSKGIAGNVMNCPSCGRARGDVQFYMKNVAEGESREENERGDIEYLSEEQAKYVSKNPDWYCSFCNSLNSDNAETCSNCGASRENSEANYFEMLKKKQEREAAELAARPASPAARTAPSSKKPLLIILAILAVIVGVFVYLNGNKTSSDLKVSSVGWTRIINIEANKQYSESDWNLPDGAELVNQKQEIHHYDSVLDHYESREVQRSRQVVDHYETYYTYKDRGNGTFEEISHERPVYTTEYYTETVREPVYVQVPRYATKYYYTIWRWKPERDAEASGEDHNAAWPELNLAENEREGQRREEYRFTVEHTGKKEAPVTYRLAESAWRNVNPGDPIFITAKRSGADPYISDAKGNKIADLERVR